MTSLLSPPTLDHPVLRCVKEIGASLDRVAAEDAETMPTREKAEALVELTRAADRVQGLLLQVLAAADDVAIESGARSTGVWLAAETRSGHGPALGLERLAQATAARFKRVGAALSAGRISLEQARVVVRALEALPAALDAVTRARAEEHLVAQAASFDTRQLRVLGRRVLEVVAPAVADDEERRLLEAEEGLARRVTSLELRRRGDGTTDVHARVPDAVAARLRTYLEAFASPRRRHLLTTGGRADAADKGDPVDPETGRRVPYAVSLGRAFCALLEAIPSDRLPRHGGSATSLVVTIDLADLRTALGAAGVSTGDRISAGEAMRLACNASILPLVLGGKGQPLHLGRARRLFDSRQRMAMAVRDGHCRARGCDIPAAWCEAHHHGRPWARGGRTDVDQGVLLCAWHHHRAHDPNYVTDTLPDGDLRFHRRE